MKKSEVTEKKVTDDELILKKKRKRLFIILGIIAIIFIVIKINKSRGFKDPFEDVDSLLETELGIVDKYENVTTLSKKIEEDYKSGKLSFDEYIMQNAYSIYDKDKLNSDYKSLSMDYYNPSELIKKIDGKFDKLSDETLMYVYKNLTLADVEWNVVEDAEVKNMNSDSDYEVKLMGSEDKVSTLDEVILSDNGNFLVYYTKKGKNAISDSNAKRIAGVLEKSVDIYKSKLGYDFKYSANYEVFSVAMSECPLGSAKGKACKLLRDNNIDTKYLNTAMPVYIIDTGDSDVLGYYLPYINGIQQITVKVSTIFKDYGANMDQAATTYSFPYFVVSSNLNNYSDTDIVTAHELFHHVQRYICGNGKYEDCPSGDFTMETTANLASINVNDINSNDTAINGHAAAYNRDIETSLDKVAQGYGAYVFASNYMDIVDNGKKYIFESVSSSNPLNYLYDNSGGKYKEVLLTTAEKILTFDYDNKLLIPYKDGKFVYPATHEAIGYDNTTKTNSMNYSSMHYYYINPRGYKKHSQLSFNGNSRDLTLLLFVYEGNGYRKLYTHTLDKEFVINIDDFSHYGQVAFALVNSKTNETLKYTYQLDNNGSKNPTVSADSLGLRREERNINDFNSFNCAKVDDNQAYNVITQVMISFNKKDKIDNMYYKGTIRIKGYDGNEAAYKTAKNIVSGVFRLMQIAYKEQFKYFKVITEEQDDRYMITFKITKNYYDALNNSLKINGQTKYDIISAIEEEGFTCHYSK